MTDIYKNSGTSGLDYGDWRKMEKAQDDPNGGSPLGILASLFLGGNKQEDGQFTGQGIKPPTGGFGELKPTSQIGIQPPSMDLFPSVGNSLGANNPSLYMPKLGAPSVTMGMPNDDDINSFWGVKKL